MKSGQKPFDPLAAVDNAILRLEQMEHWARILRLTAPEAVAKLGDLSCSMKPTAIGFRVELTTEKWVAIAIEHQLRFAGGGAR